jgi:hypothetical protein
MATINICDDVEKNCNDDRFNVACDVHVLACARRGVA